jgi:predicted TIM-barrel enzyme
MALQLKGEFSGTPILVGSGVNEKDGYEALNIADGIIIGTSLKVDVCTSNSVDIKRVRNFIKVARGG